MRLVTAGSFGLASSVSASALVVALAACAPSNSLIAPPAGRQIANHLSGAAHRTSDALTVLYSFQPGTDGVHPRAGVLVDALGNMFGTTQWGGAYDWGTVYELKASSGTYTESIIFDCTLDSGVEPWSIPLQDSSGNLFVVTDYNSSVVELSPSGSGYIQSSMVDFTGPDGGDPTAGLLPVGDRLYTAAHDFGAYQFGTIAVMDAADLSDLSPAYAFQGPPRDGAGPASSLVADSSGTLYGTTNSGGSKNLGTVFSFEPRSGKEKVIWSFKGGKSGSDPRAPVVLDGEGNIYGTTFGGGRYGLGVAFELTPKGRGYSARILHSFGGPPNDGQFPESGLTLVDNVLYGATFTGGTNNDGTIFSISTTGSDYAVVHSFDGADGIGPEGALVAGPGALYGTTLAGGASGAGSNGVVYAFVP